MKVVVVEEAAGASGMVQKKIPPNAVEVHARRKIG